MKTFILTFTILVLSISCAKVFAVEITPCHPQCTVSDDGVKSCISWGCDGQTY